MRRFEYDPEKDIANQRKHGVSFAEAKFAFDDPRMVIKPDDAHSFNEHRLFCFGKVNGDILTVRFTLRGKVIRIFGAAYWRKGRKIYEKAQRSLRE